MKNIITVLIFTFLSSIILFSQEVAPNKYYIEFTDKDNNEYTIDKPEEFLSPRALSRREKQDIEISYSDLPVTKTYLEALRNLGVKVINTSKWFNSALIYTENPNKYFEILGLDFVKYSPDYEPVINDNHTYQLPSSYKNTTNGLKFEKRDILTDYDYGSSGNQIRSTNAHKLHEEGYRGNGMLIAVIDAGFENVEQLTSLKHLYDANKVISSKEFLTGDDNPAFFTTHSHGTSVFSIIGALQQGELIGSAPEADFALLVSEDNEYENYIEEINWISAAEYADSLGADVINVSLGYVFFDMADFDHSFDDLDGNHAISSKAATHASSKGIIIAIAMGNSGKSQEHPWLSAPADGKDILSVGAIDQNLKYASFSSKGPSADGRTKPDVVAIGESTYYQNSDNSITQGNGTSFSTPLISGMVACLWQKHPDKNNLEIMDAIRKSASLYNNPTAFLGYGIPDFEHASEILKGSNIAKQYKNNETIAYPNPFSSILKIRQEDLNDEIMEIRIIDLVGREQYFITNPNISKNSIIEINNLEKLNQGVYILNIVTRSQKFSHIITKQ